MIENLGYWENLLLFCVMLNKASAHLYTFGNDIYDIELLDKHLSVHSEK